ncbi:MAG: SPOR domain-containing protein [Rhodocyclaceae bacterium]|nr:SPOR domain-containing protein [Rhodocyclaceae bacterium]
MVFFVLLMLNLLAAAGLAGMLGSHRGKGEPERLTNQLRPDAIRLVAPDRLPPEAGGPEPESMPAADVPEEAAPPEPEPVAESARLPDESSPMPSATVPVPVPRACVRFVELTDQVSEALTAMAGGFDGPLEVADSAELRPSSYWVHVPPLENMSAAEGKVREIRGQGVRDLFILQEEGPFQFAISLGLFKTESSAKLHLRRLEARGVSGGVITARGKMIHRLEIRGPVDALATLASDSAASFEDLEREPCEP